MGRHATPRTHIQRMSQRRVALERGGNRLFTFEGAYSSHKKTGNLLELFRQAARAATFAVRALYPLRLNPVKGHVHRNR
jgi:hypothetical protein